MSESHIEQQIKARIAAARRRTEDMRRQRAELAAARRAGLAKRHAAKLARQATQQREATGPGGADDQATVVQTTTVDSVRTTDGTQ